MINYGIFDIGNVLQIQDVNGPLTKDVAKTFNVSEDLFEEFRQKNEIKLLHGSITERQYWIDFKKYSKSKQPLPKRSLLLKEYKKHFYIDKDVLNIIKKLKEKGIKLACLTDTQEPHTKFNKKMGLYEEFSVQVFSHDVGMTKPNIKIYQYTLEKLGANPKETFYVDDRKANLVPAKKLGMKIILFKSANKLEEELKSLKIF